MEAGVAFGLSEVVHVVNDVTNAIRGGTKDDEHKVVHFFLSSLYWFTKSLKMTASSQLS